MMQVAQLVSPIFMMVLCIFASPADKAEIRIDLIGEHGYIDTLLIERTEQEVKVYDERGDERKLMATIRRNPEKPMQFEYRDARDREEIIDLMDEIPELADLKLHKVTRKTLRTKDGSQIRLQRSGKVLYLTVTGERQTYVIH